MRLIFSRIISHEKNSILGKCVVGKKDVDIAEMIERLNNSDWVKEGKIYFEKNNGVCPFCQQTTTELFRKSLTEYFDESYDINIQLVRSLGDAYKFESARILENIDSIPDDLEPFLDYALLDHLKAKILTIVNENHRRINDKLQEPSKKAILEPVSDACDELRELIAKANAAIDSHNQMVDNLSEEKKKVTAQVWKYIIANELAQDIEEFIRERNDIQKAITSINDKIQSESIVRTNKQNEIDNLEKQTTSIEPTISEINSLLIGFGFDGFSLKPTDDGTRYQLIRPNGEHAIETLSEGEKTFITFLYFFHLLKGSNRDSGVTLDRIVVFDDPISSLDSDVLFIVSSLIRHIINEVKTNNGYIKQVFIMTHNVYFHKEVTFNKIRQREAANAETFWIVKKSNCLSNVFRYACNPISTSYQLLWQELARPSGSCLSIQNNMRRILENYFKILGGIDSDQICKLFDGTEKQICNSLFSWMNDGSHSAFDDHLIATDDSTIGKYREIFKNIFYKSGHNEHYEMMMREASKESLSPRS